MTEEQAAPQAMELVVLHHRAGPLAEAEHVDLAVELAQNRTRRLGLRERIDESRHLVFADTSIVRALEEFLEAVVNTRHRR